MAPSVISVTSSRLSMKTVSGRSTGIRIARRSPYSSRMEISRSSSLRACVKRGAPCTTGHAAVDTAACGASPVIGTGSYFLAGVATATGLSTNGPGSAQGGVATGCVGLPAFLAAAKYCAATLSMLLHSLYAATLSAWAVLAAASAALALASSLGGGNLADTAAAHSRAASAGRAAIRFIVDSG